MGKARRQRHAIRADAVRADAIRADAARADAVGQQASAETSVDSHPSSSAAAVMAMACMPPSDLVSAKCMPPVWWGAMGRV